MLPVIKYEVSSEIHNSGKLVSTTLNLTVSQYLKTSSMTTVVVLINVLFDTVKMCDLNVKATAIKLL